MKLVKKTDEYSIFQRGDNRYAVRDADKNPVNGDDKVRILLAEDLIKAALPVAPEAEAPVEEEAVAESEEAAEADAPEAEQEAVEATAEEAPAEEEPSEDEEDK
jgi:hypothetical protein